MDDYSHLDFADREPGSATSLGSEPMDDPSRMIGHPMPSSFGLLSDDRESIDSLQWLNDRSLWQAPPTFSTADSRDSFLLGGGGHSSARLGMQDTVATMDRILIPSLSSANFSENNNFRQDLTTISRGSFYPPFTFKPTEQHIWRVRRTGFVITEERDTTYSLMTVSAVHPERHCILRFARLTNISNTPQENIGISFDAAPDVPYPSVGHRSICWPLGNHEILERVEEIQSEPGLPQQALLSHPSQFHFIVRGIMEGYGRGYQNLFVPAPTLAPGGSIESVHYLVPGLYPTQESAVDSAQIIRHHLEVTSLANLFREIYAWWQKRYSERTQWHVTDSTAQEYADLLDANAILQTSCEGANGGYIVIDDYTGSWVRDQNGSHLFGLDLGQHWNIRDSMNRYYGLDRTLQALDSHYPNDIEPRFDIPESDWEHVDPFVTGDVPNFRTLWYWWYFHHTADLNLIRDRFDYLKGAFLHQRLHDHHFLAEYCYDETYGIGPIAAMRTGYSTDNTFLALAAARALGWFAGALGRDDAEWLRSYAEQIAESIQKNFWMEERGYYAMRLKPDGSRDDTPLSVGLLRPTWLGELLLQTEEEKSRASKSACYVFDQMYSKDGFVRLIPSHNQTATMTIGYLLKALKRMNHPGLDRAIPDLPKWADPSGTFGEYLEDSSGGPTQCYEHLAHRNRIWESGINSDALMFALTGFAPSAAQNHVSFAPHLPKHWPVATQFETSNLLAGNRRMSMKQFREPAFNGVSTKVVIRHHSESPIQVTLQLRSNTAKKIRCEHQLSQKVDWSKNQFGVYVATLTFETHAGEEVVVTY